MSSQLASDHTTAAAPSRSLLRSAATAFVVALVANLVILAIATAIVDVPDNFTPLDPGPTVIWTLIGVAAAAGVYRLLLSRASDPVSTFRQKVVPVAFVLSLIPDVLIWAMGSFDGAAKAETVLPLMLMHVAAAAACWALLPTTPSARRPQA